MANPKYSPLDTNKDGKISAQEAAAGGGGLSVDALGVAPIGPGNNRGAPLLPYKIPTGSDPTQLSFQDNSAVGQAVAAGTGQPLGRTPPRYYESDALAPIQWSPELRAQLQRSMYQIGLYGNDKVTLGSWGSEDQGAFAELLKQANVEGRAWFEQLAAWRAAPPVDLLDKIKAASGPPLHTMTVTNPIDIQAQARATSRQLLGKEDPNFVASSVDPVQQQEIAQQQAQMNDQAAGGGGVVATPAAPANVLEDKLRREQPLAVDGHSFVNQFSQFLHMLGPQ